MKYPNILYTALLSTLLVVPYALYALAPALQPYPALLIPGGAGRINTAGDQMELERTSIYGRVAGFDAWTRLSPPKFLSPIPAEFFPMLVERNFGLSPVRPIAIRSRVGAVITIQPHKVGEDELKKAKQWLRARLQASGCDANVIRITQEVVTFRRSDGVEIAVRSENDKVFELR
jgi:hypothetical protein